MIDTEITRTFDRRSALFLTTGVILTSALVLRMLQMQVFNYRDYLKKSENNSFRIQLNLPERGKILSSLGRSISHDAPIYRIYIIPEETDDINTLISTVAQDLNLGQKRIDRIYAKLAQQPKFQPILISQNTKWAKLAEIQAKNLPGLRIDSGFARIYELGPAGAQLFGYVGAPKDAVAGAPFFTTGITGLEKRFDNEMAGTPGQTALIANAEGRITGEDKSQYVAPIVGNNIKTTINDNIQRALYDALTVNRAGCGMVMNIENGDVLAMVSTPSFDPNIFNQDDADEYLSSLKTDTAKPFMNKVLEGLYPPGSTFKIVVALAALESGATNINERIFCPGHWHHGDRDFNCWEKKGHGWMNVVDALKHSCDVYFYQIALRIKIDAIKNMALKLGFTETFFDGILAREMPGIMPDREWKEKNKGVQWVHGDTIISGIGQGFVLANCAQLVTMVSRAVSNRRVVPRIIYSTTQPNFEKLGLQQKNIDIVKRGMEEVLRPGGTAAGSAIDVNGQHMAGKTGTSQVRSISKAERMAGVLTNEQLKWNMRNHGLFVGYAPLEHPKYAICTITEHSGGAGSAVRSAAATMRMILKGGA